MWKTPSVKIVGLDDYARVKAVLNQGRHPVFVGKSTYRTAAMNGGAFIFCLDGKDVATALVSTRRSVLQVLNVLPAHRRSGVGAYCLHYIKPNFARVIESAVPWFEYQGYERIGTPKHGIRYITYVMVRSDLRTLAGRLRKVYGDHYDR